MRHGISGNRLNRFSTLRKATVRDIAKATLIRQRICTTKAKAKEARKLVDRLITLGKSSTLAARRRAFAILCDHALVSDLFNRTAPRFKNRNGGYTRIILLGNRRGDNAHLVFLELTEKEEKSISKPKSEAVQKKETGMKDEQIQHVSPAENLTPEAGNEPPTKKPSKKVIEKKKDLTPETEKHLPHKAEGHAKTTHERKDLPDKGKNILGGFKKMFQRKSPGQK